ncbi:hypothetical protein LMG29542_07453 [Paraburkholderia humisilvae]|uniref:Transposase IS891/IS1136/IS1341 domain-containing protein n=2 Tax=Paraburkholderia humisilvae TaxID=627669 RepID=A0A6J5F9G5_9BURK|nr:hypothetical protein LMG29542_07453 [Paraburkholderia humisilvae]
MDTVGRFHVSILCDDVVSPKKKVKSQVGISVGLTHFALLLTVEKIDAPDTFRKNESKLAMAQRRLAKKQIGFANRRKARLKVAKLHARVAGTRRDLLTKLSILLINGNQVITIESLVISNMQKHRALVKSISDANWSEFVRQPTYKAERYGRTLIGINSWYPSSKRCGDRGQTVARMPLSVRGRYLTFLMAFHCEHFEKPEDFSNPV